MRRAILIQLATYEYEELNLSQSDVRGTFLLLQENEINTFRESTLAI